jgi:predicted  nucleic acid-binding Zn-ribbon protein
MALSKCAKCESTRFEKVHSQVLALDLVQCANCGAVFSALDTILLQELKKVCRELLQRPS